MVGRIGGGLHFLVEIELRMAKMPAFTNLNVQWVEIADPRRIAHTMHLHIFLLPQDDYTCYFGVLETLKFK